MDTLIAYSTAPAESYDGSNSHEKTNSEAEPLSRTLPKSVPHVPFQYHSDDGLGRCGSLPSSCGTRVCVCARVPACTVWG